MNGDGAANKKQQPQRQLDILREHRPYCPYVVRSTVLPSLPAPSPTSAQSKGHARSTSLASLNSLNSSSSQVYVQPGAMEGWKTVLTIVSRYGNVQRQRLGLNRVSSGRPESLAESGVDDGASSIEAMVADVKSHGVSVYLAFFCGVWVLIRG